MVQNNASVDEPSVECEKDYWYIPIDQDGTVFALMVCLTHRKYVCYLPGKQAEKLPDGLEEQMTYGLKRNCRGGSNESRRVWNN